MALDFETSRMKSEINGLYTKKFQKITSREDKDYTMELKKQLGFKHKQHKSVLKS